VPHLPAGGHLGAEALDACIDPEWSLPTTGQGGYMGVDVGSRLHVVLVACEGKRRRMVYCDSVRTFAELDALMARYDVDRAVIDANPERREAQAFAKRHRGQVTLAFYPNWADVQRSELAV
jgi:hypothetical protein